MRIAYICGTESWGGLEMNQAKNAQWMLEKGHEVWAFCLENTPFHNYCAENNIPVVCINKHRKYYDFKAAKQLRNQLNNLNIDHLILRDVRDMSVSVAAKFWGKSSFKVHYFMEMQLGVSKRNLLHTIRFRQLDTWSCPLEWLKTQVLEKTRMPKNKVIVIPSGINRAPFTNNLSQETARTLLSLPQDKIIIGLAGRFDPQKGQLLLLEALQQATNKEIVVLFLGAPTVNEGDDYAQAMEQFSASHFMSDRVVVRPFRKDIEVFYKAIDAFVMASKAETVGMVTIEALASGTTVIGSNAGGTIELLHNGELGYLFESLNAQSLAQAIDAFVSNPKKWSNKTLSESTVRFDHEQVIALVEERLKSV
jgi:glycosyltransferase involved in cell wall biosynthesis